MGQEGAAAGPLSETLGLAVRPRTFHNLLEISQKIAQELLKRSQVAFCNESCSKVTQKKEKRFVALFLYCLMQKNKKSTISKHFVQFFSVTTIAKYRFFN